ncbi:UPF0665 family protein c [Cordyceps fumosorosea ARSEF 2679]|uniref:UPF0665 family protein c n=1 Tax=Cordyceps fumosorosea (strain ARSEF 2679) TaxID=1081104 RepID=A0A168BX41_CORFA|nr:UPF0665 family protein c [Cordyceps fumosorosea ARSEF 2679]OAA70658.1 UPF0665 family protein c [Cordyceps fumosorosea ARSEF 2679]
MHYIRLLRPPKVIRQAGLHLELVLTVTTDLGDSFLYPDVPIDLHIVAEIHGSPNVSRLKLTEKGQVTWRPGLRVSKQKIALPRPVQAALASGARVDVCVAASSDLSAEGARDILFRCEIGEGNGQVMPVWASLSSSDEGVDVSTRRIVLDDVGAGKYLVEVEEEIGESIARHIWDAGVVAMCSVAGAYLCPGLDCSQQSLPNAIRTTLSSKSSLNILELGCGVGILGIGLATLFPELRKEGLEKCTVMMTDLEEAEERAKSNMRRIARSGASNHGISLLYENLDWEDGRKGTFGPEVASRYWDLVIISDCTYNVDMLPALVETLGALESSSASRQESDAAGTEVFLATKPRHASERAFFDLMANERWSIQDSQTLNLPVLGSEEESIELYLFQRR